MGVLNNTLIRIISTVFLAGASLASSSAMAADGTIESASEPPVVSESSVSMSPKLVADAGLIEAAPAALLNEPGLPVEALTRAASRAKIADMSPVTWLASYGPVVVGRAN